MIVPMKKVSLVVMDKYRETSLKQLRKAGVVHLEKKNIYSHVLAELLTKKAQLENAIMLLKPYKSKVKADSKDLAKSTDTAKREGFEFFRHITNLDEERKALQEKSADISREQTRIKNWGNFNPADIAELKENGIIFDLYELTPHAFKSLPAGINYIVLKRTKALVYVVVLGGVEVSGESPVELGKYSLSALASQDLEIQKELKNIEICFSELCPHESSLEKDLAVLAEQIEFQTASEDMRTLENVPAQSAVSWISGFVPIGKVDLLKDTAVKNGWALMLSDPAPTDFPPTQLQNGTVARIIQPLFSFLGTLPAYREFDISLSYLIFFGIFFAMILGDAGYGVVIMLLALGGGLSYKKKNGAFPDLAKLLLFLSFTTIAWGAVTGSWFMVSHTNLPAFLRVLILPPFNNTGPVMQFPLFLQDIFRLPAEVPMDEFKTRWSIQFLCFTIALVQLTLARGKRIMRLLPSLTAVAQVGWLLFVSGIYFLVLTMLLGIEFPQFAFWLMGLGFGLVLIFSEQHGGNFFVNIGKGFAGLFPIFLKAISCFADVISYIRLFAVGMAGAMIGITFNQMAFPESGLGVGMIFVIRLVLAVVLVVFGHGLNLMLASLSVIVHGVRLNLLEYAGNHLDMEWSGYAYNPFKQKTKK